MKRASSSFVLPMLSVLALAACEGEGLGRPVVDRSRTGESFESCEMRRAVRCDDVIGAPRELEVGVQRASSLPVCVLNGLLTGARITGTLRSCRLMLDASMFEEFEIFDATLEDVLIQLDGQVRLRMVEGRTFQVGIDDGAAADATRPPLVQISHSTLRWTHIRAGLLELESTLMEAVALDVGQLSAVDIHTKESLLLARQATISASNLSATQVGGGETLMIAGTKAINSRFAAGEGATRLYDTEVTGGVVDGQLVSDVSTFSDCRFGVDASTALHAWFTSINTSVLCAGLEQVRYSSGTINCSRCEGPLRNADADVCTDTFASAFERNRDCDSLLEPLVCEEFPRDARPLDF